MKGGELYERVQPEEPGSQLYHTPDHQIVPCFLCKMGPLIHALGQGRIIYSKTLLKKKKRLHLFLFRERERTCM